MIQKTSLLISKLTFNKINPEHIQKLILYGMFGVVAAIADISTLFVLTEFANLYYLISAGIAYCIGITTNYLLNKHINFKNKSKKLTLQLSIFLIISLIGLALNQLLIYLFVELIGLHYLIAKIISGLIIFPLSFISHKIITFGKIK